MPDADRSKSRWEGPLSSALRDLARSSPRSASEATRAALAGEFHRHHLRRKATRMSAIVAIAVIVFGGWLGLHTLLRHQPPVEQVEVSAPSPGSQPNTGMQALDRREPQPGQSAKAHERISHPAISEEEASQQLFVALPSFAFATPGEDLRLIRVEMPLSSLRLLGARVNDELIIKTVVADLLVGSDGTPYAFRLIT